MILNWNQKYSNSIHIDTNHTDSNQPIPDNSTNIGSIHDSENIHAIDNILTSLVHSTVHASRIFNYGSASDPPSPPHDPPVAAALEEADIYLIHEYIWRRQASITAHVACFPIYKLFTDMERRLGTSRIMRWWDQDIVQ